MHLFCEIFIINSKYIGLINLNSCQICLNLGSKLVFINKLFILTIQTRNLKLRIVKFQSFSLHSRVGAEPGKDKGFKSIIFDEKLQY